MIDMAHFEVALRNALDRQMIARHARRHERGDWLDDEHLELGRDPNAVNHRAPYRDIAAARQRVTNNKRPTSHDQIISETSFGLWQQLVSKGQVALWPDLVAAFPHAPNRSQTTVSQKVHSIRTIRNRISHHHRVWAQPWRRTHYYLLTLARYIDPNLADWIRSNSAVVKIRERP